MGTLPMMRACPNGIGLVEHATAILPIDRLRRGKKCVREPDSSANREVFIAFDVVSDDGNESIMSEYDVNELMSAFDFFASLPKCHERMFLRAWRYS